MTAEVSELLKKALALPPEARAALAGSLLESLDEHPVEEGVGEAWAEEIKRRIEEIDSGKVQMIPYEEVRLQISALKLERLRRDVRGGTDSGPTQPWSETEMKREGRRRLTARQSSAK